MGLFNHHASGSSDPPPPGYGAQSELMGQANTVPEKSQPMSQSYQPPTFGCLQLARSDRMRTICLPQEANGHIEEAIRRVWAPGIQNADWFEPGSWEWKLKGNPWHGYGAEAVPARRLVAHVLHAMAAVGWHLHATVDLSKKSYDKDTLIFQQGQPRQRYFFSISFNQSDKIRIIDPPNPAVTQAFRLAVQSSWARGVQKSWEKEPGCWEMKLAGQPWWTSDGVQINNSRLVACQILTAMDAHGFELLASCDISNITNGDNGSADCDTWFFASK